jgi:hypothetical protein
MDLQEKYNLVRSALVAVVGTDDMVELQALLSAATATAAAAIAASARNGSAERSMIAAVLACNALLDTQDLNALLDTQDLKPRAIEARGLPGVDTGFPS